MDGTITLLIDDAYRRLEPRLRYVLTIFQEHYQIERPFTIQYGAQKEEADLRIPPGPEALAFFSSGSPLPERISWFTREGKRLPALFGGPDGDILFCRDGTWTIGFDLLLSAFFFLSCWQESQILLSGPPARLAAGESFLVREGIHRYPVVNYYLDLLAEALGRGGGPVPVVKGGLSAALTHDIDRCRLGFLEDGYLALSRGRILTALRLLGHRLTGRDVWFNFEEILACERELGVRSTFFFIGTKRVDLRRGGDYSAVSPSIRRQMERIRSQGSEVALHGSIGSAADPARLKAEASLLGAGTAGNRFHFLAFRLPEALDTLEAAGMRYDSSLGFAETTGFRNGCVWPCRPYHTVKERPATLVEFPLQIMDQTYNKYMELTPEESLRDAKYILDEVDRFRGQMTILWHNSFFSGIKYGAWRCVYEDIIRELLARGARIDTLQQLAREYDTDAE